MTSKTFTSGTIIDSAWLNDANTSVYTTVPSLITTVASKAASGANTDITSLNAPALGAATSITQTATDNSTKVATTAQVQAAAAAQIALLANGNLTNTHYFQIGLSTSNSVDNSNYVTYGGPSLNAGAFNTSTGKWTVPSSGVYLLTGVVATPSSANTSTGTITNAFWSTMNGAAFASWTVNITTGLGGQYNDQVFFMTLANITAGDGISIRRTGSTTSSTAIATYVKQFAAFKLTQ